MQLEEPFIGTKVLQRLDCENTGVFGIKTDTAPIASMRGGLKFYTLWTILMTSSRT